MTPLIQLREIKKSFFIENRELPVLKGISLDVQKGDMISIIGTSGSGKSTLMNIIGLMDRASSGQYLLDGRDVGTLSDDDLSTLSNHRALSFSRFTTKHQQTRSLYAEESVHSLCGSAVSFNSFCHRTGKRNCSHHLL